MLRAGRADVHPVARPAFPFTVLGASLMTCPQCYAEYRPGFTMCSDCRVALVDAPIDEWDDEISSAIARADEKRALAKKFMLYGLGALVAVIGFILLETQVRSVGAIPLALAFIGMYVCFIISAFNYAESKGYSGMVGVACMIFGVIGILILLSLRDKARPLPLRR
jgi:hypothetical protein